MTDRRTDGRTDARTDRRTDRRTGKNNMSPDPVEGRHNDRRIHSSEMGERNESAAGLLFSQ